MPLRALLLSEDVEVAQVLRPVLPELGIHTDQCASTKIARWLLSQQKYEAIIIDADVIGSLGFLNSLRQLPMTRHAIIFAVIHSVSVSIAFQAGANFVLEKPVTHERATKSFHAALGMLMRERRRYYRHPIEMLATLEYGKTNEAVTVHNLSEGGMAVKASPTLLAGLAVTWNFELPDRDGLLRGGGEVTWANQGMAGICFTFVPQVYKRVLEEWLAERSDNDVFGPLHGTDEAWSSER